MAKKQAPPNTIPHIPDAYRANAVDINALPLSQQMRQSIGHRIVNTAEYSKYYRQSVDETGLAETDPTEWNIRMGQAQYASVERAFEASHHGVEKFFGTRQVASRVASIREQLGASQRDIVKQNDYNYAANVARRDQLRERIEAERAQQHQAWDQYRAMTHDLNPGGLSVNEAERRALQGVTDPTMYKNVKQQYSILKRSYGDIMQRESRMNKDVTGLAVAEQQLREASSMGLDPRSQVMSGERTIAGYERQLNKLQGRDAPTFSDLKSKEEELKAFNEAVKKAKEALAEFSKNTSDAAKQEDYLSKANAAKNAADRVNAAQMPPSWLGKLNAGAEYAHMAAGVINNVGRGVGVYAGYNEFKVDMAANVLQARTANMQMNNNAFFSTYSGLVNGDIAAYRRGTEYANEARQAASGLYGMAKTGANARIWESGLYATGNTVDAVATSIGNAPGNFLTGGKAKMIAGAVGDATNVLATGAEGALNTYKQAQMAPIDAFYRTKRVHDSYLDYASERDKVQNFAAQQYRDMFMNVGGATVGLGTGQRGAAMDTFLNRGTRLQLAGVGIADPSQGIAAFTGSAGREWGPLDLMRAGKAQMSGQMGIGQYAALTGAMTDVGGNGKNFAEALEIAVRSGMDNSKNMQQMVQATVSLASREIRAGVFGTGGEIGTMVAQLSGTQSIANMPANIRAQMVAEQLSAQQDVTTNKQVNLKGVTEYLTAMNADPTMTNLGAANFMGTSKVALDSMRRKLGAAADSGNLKAMKEAAQAWNFMGLGKTIEVNETSTVQSLMPGLTSAEDKAAELSKVKSKNFANQLMMSGFTGDASTIADILLKNYDAPTKKTTNQLVGEISKATGLSATAAQDEMYRVIKETKQFGMGLGPEEVKTSSANEKLFQNVNTAVAKTGFNIQDAGTKAGRDFLNKQAGTNFSAADIAKVTEMNQQIAGGGEYNFQMFNGSVNRFSEAVDSFVKAQGGKSQIESKIDDMKSDLSNMQEQYKAIVNKRVTDGSGDTTSSHGVPFRDLSAQERTKAVDLANAIDKLNTMLGNKEQGSGLLPSINPK